MVFRESFPAARPVMRNREKSPTSEKDRRNDYEERQQDRGRASLGQNSKFGTERDEERSFRGFRDVAGSQEDSKSLSTPRRTECPEGLRSRELRGEHARPDLSVRRTGPLSDRQPAILRVAPPPAGPDAHDER